MTRVLVTGGTGVLGSSIVRQLAARGATVRILSRRSSPQGSTTEWAQGDLLRGTGLAAAFGDVDVVVHSATSQKAQEDLDITKRVLDAAKQAGVKHALYASIVGIDTLGFFDYYAAKLEGEKLFAASGLPYSIQRATQFHDFVTFLLSMLGRGPLLVLPKGVTLQPVDAEDVAVRIAQAALNEPAGHLPDVAGPDIRSLEDLARAWRHATGKRKVMVSLPLPLPVFKAMASGQLTAEHADRIGSSWEAWLARHAKGPNGYQQARKGKA